MHDFLNVFSFFRCTPMLTNLSPFPTRLSNMLLSQLVFRGLGLETNYFRSGTSRFMGVIAAIFMLSENEMGSAGKTKCAVDEDACKITKGYEYEILFYINNPGFMDEKKTLLIIFNDHVFKGLSQTN